MTSWAELLTQAEPGEHVVQLYGNDDRLLARNVGRYLAEGLRRLDGLVVIATPEHVEAIRRYLSENGADARLDAERAGRLVFLDARATLDRLLRDGQPDRVRFRDVVGGVLAQARRHAASGRVRAFGEMVNLLWGEGRHDAADRLERLWNTILADGACSLYCAYGIDIFEPHGGPADLTAIIGAHSHLLAGPATLLSTDRARQ
jgi:MEDS: MEthanogen/methylotroph, DcmR Sensory domain